MLVILKKKGYIIDIDVWWDVINIFEGLFHIFADSSQSVVLLAVVLSSYCDIHAKFKGHFTIDGAVKPKGKID